MSCFQGQTLIWPYLKNCWSDRCETLDLTNNLEHGCFKVKFRNSCISGIETALSQEWDDWLTWNEKDLSHPFTAMILTSVTMLGWADVPDSDRGGFGVGVPSTYLVTTLIPFITMFIWLVVILTIDCRVNVAWPYHYKARHTKGLREMHVDWR